MQAHEQESGFQEETRSNNFNPVLHKWIQHCSELEALHHLACPNPGQTYKNPHLEQLYKLTILTDPVLQPNAANPNLSELLCGDLSSKLTKDIVFFAFYGQRL